MSEQGYPADRIDTGRPHPARMYDYWLGGHDNYEIDRDAAERVLAVSPGSRDAVRANRAFQRRAVHTLVAEHGVRQIIDIGTGIPTSPNTHEIAQAVAPETPVVYVDNDPIVGVHAQARLTGVGATRFLLADARRPEVIFGHPDVKTLIDLDRPVAVLLIAVLHFVTDEEEPRRIVASIRDALAPGSFLVLSHGTADQVVHDTTEASRIYRSASASLNLRPRAQVAALFDGFELLEPGLVTAAEWRPEAADPEPFRYGVYAGVGRKL